jgi:hypothetical protein
LQTEREQPPTQHTTNNTPRTVNPSIFLSNSSIFPASNSLIVFSPAAADRNATTRGGVLDARLVRARNSHKTNQITRELHCCHYQRAIVSQTVGDFLAGRKSLPRAATHAITEFRCHEK